MPDYPNDADGAALARVAADGSDMTKPMSVDFMVAVSDEPSAQAVAAAADSAGYDPSVSYDPEDAAWTVYCARTMVATYEAVIRCQQELDALSQPLGGHTDGWGTYGNAAD